MCSIIGCRYWDHAAPILVKGLQRMEYRGYDSVGLAIFDHDIQVKKGVGKVQQVNDSRQLDQIQGKVGIGHTRWATHGAVCEKNAHPHLDTIIQKVAIVHNGMIENYEALKQKLHCPFQSDTDSEVIANLLALNYSKTGDAKAAMIRTLPELQGFYAFIALFEDGTLAAARNHEPLIMGLAPMGVFLASDVLGFIEYADEAIYLDNQEFLILDEQISIFDFKGKVHQHKSVKLSRELLDVKKDEYAHFTLKEIHEQPKTILLAENDNLSQAIKILNPAKRIFITGSGTSYNAALVGKYLLNKYQNLIVEPIISSEAKFLEPRFDQNSVLIAISQSGESADVLDIAETAKKAKSLIVSIVNSERSSLAHLSDICLGLHCGPEIGVAATKSFTSQLAILHQLAQAEIDLNHLSEAMKQVLKDDSVLKLASKLQHVTDIYILGRGVNYAIASEASLKIKELAYIHAEGLPGGELKHGPLALMDEHAYVILLHPEGATYNEMISSAEQIKSRGAKIIGVSSKNHKLYDEWLKIPVVRETHQPFIEIIPLQLLAYYLALERDSDPDYPRNLAKCVTVK